MSRTRLQAWRTDLSRPPRTISPMAVRVEWVPYGKQAADRLRLLISDAKGGEPLEPVTVFPRPGMTWRIPLRGSDT